MRAIGSDRHVAIRLPRSMVLFVHGRKGQGTISLVSAASQRASLPQGEVNRCPTRWFEKNSPPPSIAKGHTVATPAFLSERAVIRSKKKNVESPPEKRPVK